MKSSIKILMFGILMLLLVTNFQADDKELFMDLDIATDEVWPNVVLLVDNSGSMSTIIFYPKDGLDGEPNTADDGYDPGQDYLTIDAATTREFTANFATGGYYDSFLNWRNNTTTMWKAQWILDDDADDYTASTGVYEKDSEDRIKVGERGAHCFEEGDWIINRAHTAVARIKTMTPFTPPAGQDGAWLDLEYRMGTFELGNYDDANNSLEVHLESDNETPTGYKLHVARLYGVNTTEDPEVRYPLNYLAWLFYYADHMQRHSVSHHAQHGIFDYSFVPDWTVTNCSAPGQLETTQQMLFTRMQVTREVLCEVSKKVNTKVRLGMYRFGYKSYSSTGAYQMDVLQNRSDEVSLTAYIKNIYDMTATTNTPLAEALADVWDYYKPGNDNSSFWPIDHMIAEGDYTPGPNPVTPVEWWCQNNYVVIMTDGESSKDQFEDTGATDSNQDGKYADSIFLNRPVHRTEPWDDWTDGWGDTDHNESDDPAFKGIPYDYDPTTATYCENYSCWLGPGWNSWADGWHGTDYLDDVAYFLNHQDMFPEDPNGYPDGFIDDPSDPEGFPGKQNIYTYAIGFNADNDMLRETAINGDGAFYSATNYQELIDAFESVLTSILLRNFAFSAITAPKKTASIQSQGVSYVGYFMPSQSASVWEGHLLANRLYDRWGFDTDSSGTIEFSELYDNEQDCLDANPGEICSRILELAAAAEWDVATILANKSTDRALYTHNGTSMVGFNLPNRDLIKADFGAGTTDTEADQIISKITQKWLGDVFHSDIDFVGPPLGGKKYLPNLDPVECDSDPTTDPDCYQYYYNAKSSRDRVIYVGTNDGVLHMLSAETGEELWGFIPQEVLPSLKNIVINNMHTYTVDGRITADDIYYRDATTSEWKTILIFGLRDGGTTFYCLDVSDVSGTPTLLWKFADSTFSGNSWGSPTIGQINIKVGANIEKRWVVFLTGGFAFNNEISNDQQGKAIFVVDASTGTLLYSVGYDVNNGAEDVSGTPHLDTATTDNIHYLTEDDVFNFSIPTSMTPIDRDSNGLVDSVYFGNIGGHMFKLDITNPDVSEWKTYVMFETEIVDVATATIGTIVDDVFDIGNDVGDFEIGWNIVGMTSGAIGYIKEMDSPKKEITVKTQIGTFQVDEVIKTRSYDPVYNPPAVAFDTCYQLWVTFGTGDRDRPRTNPGKGRFIALMDTNQVWGNTLGSLSQLTFASDTLTQTTVDLTAYNGWYFNFPDDNEKLFDPEHIILPDENFVPHIYFNTYQPPEESSLGPQENPCDTPGEGEMSIYDIAMAGCSPVEVSGGREEGRIAGGGIYKGKEYVKYIGSGNVGSVPPLDEVDSDLLEYAGTIIFWKEKKR